MVFSTRARITILSTDCKMHLRDLLRCSSKQLTICIATWMFTSTNQIQEKLSDKSWSCRIERSNWQVHAADVKHHVPGFRQINHLHIVFIMFTFHFYYVLIFWKNVFMYVSFCLQVSYDMQCPSVRLSWQVCGLYFASKKAALTRTKSCHNAEDTMTWYTLLGVFWARYSAL